VVCGTQANPLFTLVLSFCVVWSFIRNEDDPDSEGRAKTRAEELVEEQMKEAEKENSVGELPLPAHIKKDPAQGGA
jgi:hypothetical protein